MNPPLSSPSPLIIVSQSRQREPPLPARSNLQRRPERGKAATSAVRKALLLRVGIDRGTGGALGPVFPGGTFEYVSLSRASACFAFAVVGVFAILRIAFDG
jgi:hypothetical protein